MPDSLAVRPKETVAELIRRHRRPLPAPATDIENVRARAVALCSAEVAHRSRDFQRVERALGLAFDRWLEPDCEQLGQFPHEAHAAAALLWLSHLQTHESAKRTPWSGIPFRSWRTDERAAWLAKRRALWSGFLSQIERYHAARELPGASHQHLILEERSAGPRLEGWARTPRPLPILRDGRTAAASG
ncbi:hypothetical protein [Reyranella sp.]|uniref:hypothetical protein n=1 Tax=Reyranella sp. TaxID=1929291 RepID=UPI0040366C84